MNRRRYLSRAGAAAGVVGGLAGCLGRLSGGDPTRGGRAPSGFDDVDLPIPTTEMRSALPRDHIPAIVDPAFASDWSGLSLPADSRGESARLPDEAPVIGVERDGEARAYPLRILDWHEVVNDTLGGPIAVTYCVLCGSGVVVDRTTAAGVTRFGVSGYLWRSDLVLYDDATDSLWSQLLATAVNGPATGERLTVLPASLTRWGAWRTDHPETTVLLPPPRSNTVRGPDATFDYFTPKYRRDGDGVVGYRGGEATLHPQELVLGVAHGGVARAYPFDAVARADVVTDSVGGLPVVVALAPGDTLVAYDRRVDGDVLAFEGDGDRYLRGGGSRWRRTTGVAVDGPHEGATLTAANDLPPMFWLGWSEFNPGTSVYGQESMPGAETATRGESEPRGESESEG